MPEAALTSMFIWFLRGGPEDLRYDIRNTFGGQSAWGGELPASIEAVRKKELELISSYLGAAMNTQNRNRFGWPGWVRKYIPWYQK